MALSGKGAPRIDGGMLLAQIAKMGEIGVDGRGGRTRLALSEQDRTARDTLVEWMGEIGLSVRVDGIGNIFGLLETDAGGSFDGALMIGSHIDTVISAGAYDGVYGVLAGLAAARAFRSAGRRPPRPLAVAAFTNEEGVRFQPDMMGSLAFAGGIPLEEALASTDSEGRSVGEELGRIGYAGGEMPGFFRPGDYLELHVEQGPILDAERVQIGVVERLQGISWQRIHVSGTANHAGTTPVRLRHDAGYAAAKIIAFLREEVAAEGKTLATVGTMELEPGAVNVIPGGAVFTVDMRDPDEERLLVGEKKLAGFLREVARMEGVEVTAERLARFSPVIFDASLAEDIRSAAENRGFSVLRMTSGAGHDAQMMARICPAAMIFVPSRGGISHSPGEDTDGESLVRGAEVLLDVAVRRLGME